MNRFTLSAAPGWFKYDDVYKLPYMVKQHGFTAFELLGRRNLDLEKMKKALDDSGITMSALLFESDDPDENALIQNNHGIVWEDSVNAFVSAVKQTAEAAKILNVKNIIVTTGNERSDTDRLTQQNNIVTALKAAAELLKGTDINLVVEPLNVLTDHAGYYLVTTNQAVEIIKQVDSPNVRLLYDIYHQQISEGNIIATIGKYIQYIAHIHAADVPGRNQPGTGELNYKNIFKALNDIGYSGYVTFECGSTADTGTVCAQMLELAGQ